MKHKSLFLLLIVIFLGCVFMAFNFFHSKSEVAWRTYPLPHGSIQVPNTVEMSSDIEYVKVNEFVNGGPSKAKFPFEAYAFSGEKNHGFDEGDFYAQTIVLMRFPAMSYLTQPSNDTAHIKETSWLYYSSALIPEGLWKDTSFTLVKEAPAYYIYSYKRTKLNQSLILISKEKPYVLSLQYRSPVSDKDALLRIEKTQESLILN